MSGRDTTVLKRITEQNQLFEATVSASNSGIVITDSLQPDEPIIFCNRAFEEMTGYLQAEILGKNCRFLQGRDIEQPGRYLLTEATVNGDVCTVELANYRKDGSLFWNEVTISPIRDETGRITNFIGIQNDISHRRNKEMVDGQQEAQILNIQLLKDEFITTAGHELRTPVTSLKATLQMMDRMIGDEAASRDRLTILSSNAGRHITKLAQLMEDLLNASKCGDGKLLPKKENFLLSGVLESYCSHIVSNEQYIFTFQGIHEINVWADPYLIGQVMVNLLVNAVRFSPASSEIKIAVERQDGCFKVSITDGGRGIPEDEIPRIFEQYYRAIDNQAGLGLGLYIASEIIRQHGGDIGVESALGEGCCFWFTLPFVQISAEKPLN